MSTHAAQPEWPAALLKAALNAVSIVLIVFLTYFFTIRFSTPLRGPEDQSRSSRTALVKAEVLRAEDQKLLTTYGAVNPATKSLRIPIARAMELVIAERLKPRPPLPAPAPGPAPQPPAAMSTMASGTPAPTPGPGAVAAAPAPARAGWAPEQLFRAVCQACHDTDGKGMAVRKAMPVIPDFTDPKWQASRTDADLLHSMVDGKGQFMLPMKEKFALTQTDPKEMLAFIRAFGGGKQVVTGGPTALPPTAMALAPPTIRSTPAPPAIPTAPASAPATGNAAPKVPTSVPSPALASGPPTSTPAAPTGSSVALAERVRLGSALYSTNCLPCHGPDGRGSLVRPAMPPIPDFTNRDWQKSHTTPQLQVSILEGKGTLMPPWRGKVTPDQANELIAFVRSFGPPTTASPNEPEGEFASRYARLRQEWEELRRHAEVLTNP